MGRKNRNPSFFDLIDVVASIAPWWVCVVLAAVSFGVFHYLAGLQAPAPKNLQEFSSALYWTLGRAIGTVGQFVAPLGFVIAAGLSAWRRKKRAELHSEVSVSSDSNALNQMTWQQFEQLVGEAFRRKDFTVRETGGGSSDGGVDLVLTAGSERYLVQCKQWRATKVNVSTVRELYGVMAAQRATGAFVVTSGTFTTDAQRFAEGRNIELIDHKQLMELVRSGSPSSVDHVTEGQESESRLSRPRCPKCGSAMQKKTARRGANAGNQFWGCADYPSCRGTLPA